MSNLTLDPKTPPEGGRHPDMYEYTGLLSKDGVPISHIGVKNLPINLPHNLDFSKIEYASLHPIESLPAFELHPNPSEQDLRRGEWLKFLKYLYDRNKVVPITVNGWQLFISPPRVSPDERTSVRVCYCKCSNERPPAESSPPLPLPQAASTASPHADGQTQIEPREATEKVHLTATPPYPPPSGRRRSGLFIRPRSLTCMRAGGRQTQAETPQRSGQLHPSYLQTLAQLHASWQFGALAELVDNSRDAHATRVNISITMVKKMKGRPELMPMLKIEDNGKGMNQEEIIRMLQFGHKRPTECDKDQIGHFGVGFKSGSMRLGKDVIVLTQTDSSRSIGFLSTSYNADKEVLEVPIVAYRYSHGIMELDESVQTQDQAEESLQAVKSFSPFNEFEIGSMFDKIGDGNGKGSGTSIFVYNLDRWGSDYALKWDDEEGSGSPEERDITIRSGRVRARPSQMSNEVKTKQLAQSLSKTSRRKGNVCNTPVELTLGRSCVEYDRGNFGIFLYWHGRLIEAYKRVGGMLHSADVRRGLIGVVDVTTLMEHEDGRTGVLNSKQSFEDCEEYAMLEEWLGEQFHDYWNTEHSSDLPKK